MKTTKQTELPSGWEMKRFDQIIQKAVLGGNYENSEANEGVPVIKMGNIERGKINIEKVQCMPIDSEYNKNDILKKGDLLFNTRNTLELVGKVSVWNDELPLAIYNSNLLKLEFKKEEVESNFFMNYVFNSNQILGQLRARATGTTSVAAIYSRDLNSIKIPLPPLSEQRAIASILSTWDSAIQTTQALIVQKEQEKKWLMQNLLTGKKRLKGFSGEWKEYCFDELLKVVKRSVKWDDNKLYKLISVRRRSGGIFFREALYGHQIKVKDLREAEVGDFLFSKMQIVHGASALVTKDFEGAKISGSYIATIAKDSKLLNMEFFDWYSRLPYFYHQALISSYGVHIEKMTFDFDTFLQLEMKLPSVEEQTAIAQVLQTADKEIELLKTKLEQQKLQKKGLMQVLLTGKVRVSEVRN